MPDQPPEDTPEVALVEDQLTAVLLPAAMLVGVADSVTVGRCSTVTVEVAAAEPPAPVQVSLRLEFAVNGPTVREPLSAAVLVEVVPLSVV